MEYSDQEIFFEKYGLVTMNLIITYDIDLLLCEKNNIEFNDYLLNFKHDKIVQTKTYKVKLCYKNKYSTNSRYNTCNIYKINSNNIHLTSNDILSIIFTHKYLYASIIIPLILLKSSYDNQSFFAPFPVEIIKYIIKLCSI